MSKVSPELSASARNGISRILQSLANCRQSELAEQLGVDEVAGRRDERQQGSGHDARHRQWPGHLAERLHR